VALFSTHGVFTTFVNQISCAETAHSNETVNIIQILTYSINVITPILHRSAGMLNVVPCNVSGAILCRKNIISHHTSLHLHCRTNG